MRVPLGGPARCEDQPRELDATQRYSCPGRGDGVAAGQRQEAGLAGIERTRCGGLRTVGARDFNSLLQRERLGSTGVGDGIAIPHGKLAKCGRIFGIFGRLERPIDFDALDGMPVDLIFLLIAPENAGADHLKALAMIARVLRSPGLAAKLRATRDASALFSLLTLTPTSNAA